VSLTLTLEQVQNLSHIGGTTIGAPLATRLRTIPLMPKQIENPKAP
jgi:hypothetical protein